MKKRFAMLMIAVMVLTLAGGCNKKPVETPPESVVTEAPKDNEVPTDTPAVTQEPEVTDAPDTSNDSDTDGADITDVPASDDNQDATANNEDEVKIYTYEDILGTWYLYSFEIEGWEELAADAYENTRVTFNEDRTATLQTGYYYDEAEPYELDPISGEIADLPEEDSWGQWEAKFVVKDCDYYYSVNESGNLIQRCLIGYDDGAFYSSSYSVYVREQQVFEPEPLVVPESVQAIMDGAGPGNWITVIAGPSEEMTAELDAAGWKLHDETDNEWLDNPITIPVELVVCNTSDRNMYVQIHEPLTGYDTTSSSTEWARGSFMYYAYINPGELARFVVNMPDDPIEATMALYMFFDGVPEDQPYYMRIYRYPFNHFVFE